ncbi:MAG: phosphotransferase family protein [Henriciella sp.]
MTDQIAEGFDIERAERWITENLPEFVSPMIWTRLAGGHSNLTYRLQSANGRQAVIRRPPLGELLPKAHDMSREWALISALGNSSVPVPGALAFCDDLDVIGVHFYVMEFVEGRPLYDIAGTEAWVPEDRRRLLAYSFIDVLANLHALDPDQIGLAELGKKNDYILRQVNTWYRSWTASAAGAQLDDPRAHDLRSYFLSNIPDQGAARIVHGDYGLHNCLIGANSSVVAVLDWEISTLGDPLADLAYALNPWPDANEPVIIINDAATRAPEMPSRRELAARYAQRTGRDLSDLDYYVGFNFWKSAAIMHGVYARYVAGQKNSDGEDLDGWRTRIKQCLTAAEHAVEMHRDKV